ncbi:hypothetical protein ACOAOT_23715 [Lacrimispora sp. AGF001]|uniref:hypothetical protein n=1 Tax=Lacrimispora sp. AGF001 TaxID=3401631 RepID=UPI003B43A907
MKYDKGRIQKTQEEWIAGMVAAGHYACVCYGYDPAVKVIEMYMQLLPGQEMKFENGVILK